MTFKTFLNGAPMEAPCRGTGDPGSSQTLSGKGPFQIFPHLSISLTCFLSIYTVLSK